MKDTESVFVQMTVSEVKKLAIEALKAENVRVEEYVTSYAEWFIRTLEKKNNSFRVKVLGKIPFIGAKAVEVPELEDFLNEAYEDYNRSPLTLQQDDPNLYNAFWLARTEAYFFIKTLAKMPDEKADDIMYLSWKDAVNLGLVSDVL